MLNVSMENNPEPHYLRQRLDGLIRRLQEVEERKGFPSDLVNLARDAVLVWAAGRTAADWIQERNVNAAEVEKLKAAGLWPW